MTKELEEIRAKFLTDDLDLETRADNEAKIREWEEALLRNEHLQGWQEHEITRSIMKQAKAAYLDCSVRLATDRTLSEADRASLYAKQDAALWLLSLGSGDPKAARQSIMSELRTALNAV